MLKYQTSTQCVEWQQSAGFLHCFAKLLSSTSCSAPSLGLTIILTTGQKCDVCLTLKCKSFLLPVPQEFLKAGLRVAQPKPACPHAMRKALSLPCDTFCSCDRTLPDWTRVTGLTSWPLFYSSQLVWHWNTSSPCSCSTAEEAAGCAFPQCSDTKRCKWKYISSDPGDESSRNEEQEHSSATFAKHLPTHQNTGKLHPSKPKLPFL